MLLDYAIVPFFLSASMAAAWLLQIHGVPNLFITPIVVGPFAGLAILLEYIRPERSRPLKRDLPLWLEAAHFVCNFELGYGAALLATALLERGLRMGFSSTWPTSWPVALQVLLAVTLYEATSYWQHRLFHRRPRLWSFHVLHHSGANLDTVRAVRFHCVDFFAAAFTAYLPLVVLGTPDDIVTLLAILVSILGIVQHANMRERTPAWLDLVICTPAVHRRHHSLRWRESDANFGNTVMWFDHLFGTYGRPHPVGPEAMGIENDPLPAGFWAQFLGPFHRPSNRSDRDFEPRTDRHQPVDGSPV